MDRTGLRPADRNDEWGVTMSLKDAIRGLLDEQPIPDTAAGVCPQGDHLRLARRWERTCQGCGQQIPTGDVGLATFDDRHTCGAGGYSHQHGCGAWNVPTEVTVDLDVAEATDDRDVSADMASAAVETARRMLDEQVEAEQDRALERARERLERAADEVLAQLEAHPEVIEDRRVLDGSETEPGAYVAEYPGVAVLEVWDYDPRDIYGDALVVTRALPDRGRR